MNGAESAALTRTLSRTEALKLSDFRRERQLHAELEANLYLASYTTRTCRHCTSS